MDVGTACFHFFVVPHFVVFFTIYLLRQLKKIIQLVVASLAPAVATLSRACDQISIHSEVLVRSFIQTCYTRYCVGTLSTRVAEPQQQNCCSGTGAVRLYTSGSRAAIF